MVKYIQGKIYHLAILKRMVLWHYVLSHFCSATSTVHLQNFFILCKCILISTLFDPSVLSTFICVMWIELLHINPSEQCPNPGKTSARDGCFLQVRWCSSLGERRSVGIVDRKWGKEEWMESLFSAIWFGARLFLVQFQALVGMHSVHTVELKNYQVKFRHS